MVASETVLVAMRGALKLGQQARAAYVDSTRRRALVLPLPDFEMTSDTVVATTFYLNNPPAGPAQLIALMGKVEAGDALSVAEQEQLLDYYNDEQLAAFKSDTGFATAQDGSTVSTASLNALVEIRQWQRGGDPNPSTLQRIAGTFVEIGVDYFLETPGALDVDSRTGRAVKGFLDGLDEIDFAEEAIGDLPRRLFVAALDAIVDNPDIVADSAKAQVLIQAATSGLVTDVNAKILASRDAVGDNLTLEQSIRSWGETVFRSLLGSVGKLVVTDPAQFVDVDDPAHSALVSGVGTALIDAIEATSAGELERVFSHATLEQLTDAALEAVAENPSLVLGDDPRLSALVGQLTRDIAGMNELFARNALPEVARLVVKVTGDHLATVWPPGVDPERNLALLAATTTLEVLSQPPAPGSAWSPELTKSDAVFVVSSVIDDLAASPGWLQTALDEHDPQLKTAMEAVLGVLRARGDQQLLTKHMGLELLSAALHAAALRSQFTAALPNGKPFVAAVVDALLDTAFGGTPEIAWRLARNEFLVGALEEIVDLLDASHVDEAAIQIVRAELGNYAQRIQNGQDASLETLLTAIENEL